MTTIKFYLLGLLALFAAGLTECTVQKRTYNKGYYVSFKKKPVQKPASRIMVSKVTKSAPEQVRNVAVGSQSTKQLDLLTSATKYPQMVVPLRKIRELKIPIDTCGDVITFWDGTEVVGKVEEVSKSTIKYRYCDQLDGPLRAVEIKKVFKIKYANGNKEVFKREEGTEQVPESKYEKQKNAGPAVKKKFNALALLSLIFSPFSFLIIPGIASVIMGGIAIDNYKKEPGKYKKGTWMATMGIIVSVSILLLFLIVLVATV